ncbi:hypothetical protein IFM47457_07427 [Aspergillus lentulus]|nr:hypothetical protein IFM47457_07427 [Aspergillus lentulus]
MKIRSDKILTGTQWVVGHSQTPSILISARSPGGTVLGRSLTLVLTEEAKTNYEQIWLINRVEQAAHWSDLQTGY